MTPEQFRRLEALYDAAFELDPAERARFVDEQCAGEEDLRQELLAALGGAGSGLTGAVANAAGAAAAAALDDNWAGRRVGPYRILRSLGSGGMGAVYLAVRDDDQFHKQVAIKTLKFELQAGSAILRFRHERQILAHLEHPNIARLLDGGATEQGMPYIVLEYVAGVEIASWCEGQRISIEQRLLLFRLVCDAVQYAHRHLIVHRDIKPGNILVTPDGVPKLLDFGIAKLLDAGAVAGAQPLTATATGLLLMTPDYASPEQVRGEAVSTATDVYSLGAVLYQLLTGQRPYALQNYDAVEIARVVCEAEVRPPSALGNRRLRGDLDVIVLKAMQKDPARRYASVVELSEDILRHLEGLPIAARPDTSVYRAVKFVRRNRIGVAATAAVVAALAAGMAVSLHQARVAQRRFAQVRELANTFLFQFYDQVTPLPGSTAVRASIVQTARKYLDGLSKEAGNDKELLMELAQAYQRLGDVQGRTRMSNLGQLDQARQSYRQALVLYERLGVNAGAPPDLRRKAASVLIALGLLEFNSEHEDAGEPVTRRALDLLADRSPDNATRMLRAAAERSLGDIRLRQGRVSEALALLESARSTLLNLGSSGYSDKDLPNEIGIVHERLARAKRYAGDLDGAISEFLELVRGTPACDEHSPPGVECRRLATRLRWVADTYTAVELPNLGEPDKAAVLYEQALRIYERLVAADPNDRQGRFDLASTHGKLGDAVWKKDPKRALDLYGKALTIAQSLVSKEQFDQLRTAYRISIARPLILLGRTSEARKAWSEVLQEASGPEAPYADRLGDLSIRQILPNLLLAEGKPAEARQALQDLIRDTEAMRSSHPDDFTPLFYLSDCYRALAAITTGRQRREALLRSAAAWHSFPATGFTRRQEQKDLAAASQ